jgi:hypothetical protein
LLDSDGAGNGRLVSDGAGSSGNNHPRARRGQQQQPIEDDWTASSALKRVNIQEMPNRVHIQEMQMHVNIREMPKRVNIREMQKRENIQY